MMKTMHYLFLAFLALSIVACSDNSLDQQVQAPEEHIIEPRFVKLEDIIPEENKRTLQNLRSEGNFAVLMAEYLTAAESEEMGNIVFFQDVGNKQLAGDFVPALSVLTDGTEDITYYVDENRPTSDASIGVSTAAIDRAMATWDGVTCSDLGMTKIPSDGRPTGFIAALLGLPGSFSYVSDVTHCGWLPGFFFDAIAPNGSQSILGVTFTIVFTDGNGNLVDTDNNGKYDVAWREIYYNDAFTWNDGASVDIESIALHEAGHGLSQAHFGKAFGTFANQTLHFAPRAVMNAAYFGGTATEIQKTDNAGHCSNWSQWPMN